MMQLIKQYLSGHTDADVALDVIWGRWFTLDTDVGSPENLSVIVANDCTRDGVMYSAYDSMYYELTVSQTGLDLLIEYLNTAMRMYLYRWSVTTRGEGLSTPLVYEVVDELGVGEFMDKYLIHIRIESTQTTGTGKRIEMAIARGRPAIDSMMLSVDPFLL